MLRKSGPARDGMANLSGGTKLSGLNPVQLTTSNIGHYCMYVYMVTHIARVWINQVRLAILLVVS